MEGLHSSKKPKYFILFDLNGTLLYKTTRRLKCAREPDKGIKKIVQIYIRPDVLHLLPPLLKNPAVRVGVYSSMKRQTVSPILDALLEKISATDKKESILIFDRDCCVADPLGENIQDTLKDLELVWTRAYAQKLGICKTNTILVENDVRKASRCLANLLRMVPYTENDIINPTLENDSLLHFYYEYLEKLINSGTPDVTEYLRKNKLPPEVIKHFDQSTEDLVKAQEDLRKLAEEDKSMTEHEEKWVKIEDIPNKDEKMKEMMGIIQSITISIDKQQD